MNSAIILCGGKGTRLGNLGKKIPKTLVKIQGKPILWYIIKVLKKNLINHLIFPLGFKGNLIKKYLKKIKEFKNINFDLISTGLETSISKRIFFIKNKIKSKHLVLLNGDAIFDFNLKKILNIHIKKNYDITFLGCSASLSYGVVAIKKNKIAGFKREINFDKVHSNKVKSTYGHVFSGISIIKSDLLKKNFKFNYDFEKEFYPKIIKRKNVNFTQINGFWYSIDNLKDIDNLKVKINKKNFNKVRKLKKKLNNENFLEK